MAYNPRFPIGATPQDPLRRRRPLPSDYPYEPEVLEAPEELPNLPVREFQAPAIPLTPGLNRPQGPGTLTPAPFRTLGQFNQWYTGQPTDILPGDVLPPSPEWGKRTPSYSRLNPPPPRMGASLPGQRPGVIARQPGTTPSPIVAPVGTPAGQPVPAIRPGQVMQPSTIPTPSQMAPRLTGQLPNVTKRDFLNTDWLEQRGQGVPQGMQVSIDRRNLTPGLGPAGQNVRAGTQVKAGLAVAPQGRALTPEERQLRTEAVIANRLAQPGQPSIEEEAITRGKQGIQQGIKDAALELYAGIPRVGSTFLNVADAIARTTGAAPVGQPGATYTQGRQPLAPSVFKRGAQALESKSEEILGRRSPDIQAREQQLNVKLAQQQDDILNQIATVAATVYKDPALARKAILTNLPMMLPPLLAGKVASTANIASALAARMTTGAIMAAGDAASSIYDTNKQALLARGIPEAEADQEAFRKSIIGLPIGATLGGLSSGTGFEAGLAGGGLGGRLTARVPQGLKQLGAKAAGLAGPIGRRAAPGITELSTEVAEETIPQVIGNVQAGLPASRNIGRTVAETIIATSPFAVQSSIGGGATKVPDELQKQQLALPPVPSVISPDRAQAYRELREKQRAAGVSPFGGQRPAGEAVPPVQPLPLAPNGGAQAAPFTPSGTLFTPGWSLRPLDEQFQERTSRGALYGLVGPEQRATSEAAMEAASAEGQPATLRDVTSTATNKNRYGQGEYGKIAQSANKAPSFSFEKLKKAYGLPEDANRLELFEPIMQNLAAELGDVIGRDISINDVHRLAYIIDESKSPADEQNVWGKWYKKYGRAYGLSEQDVWNLQDIAAGGGRGSFFDDYAVQQTLLGEPTSKGQNKDIQKIVREDMAKLLGYDVNDPRMKEFSQASMSPDMWRLWARSRGFGDQKRYPGVMQKLEMMIEEGELRKTAKKTDKADDMAIIPRKGQWPGTTPTTGATPPSPPSPVAPTAPTAPPAPQRPVPPSTAPTRYQPSSLKRQYSEMVQEGVPRAPRSYVPGVPLQRQGPGYQMTGKGRGFRYTTTAQPQGPMPPGPLMVVDREREEREQARQTLERLHKKSPFARSRQAERERAEAATVSRKPPTPPEAAAPTVAPTPPVTPPAPSGAAQPASVTPPRSPRQRLVDADWTIESSQRFTGPDGSIIEREDGSRGRRQGWVHTDAVGNRTNYNTAQEAIEAVLAEPSTAVQPEVKAQPKAGRAKAQPEAKPTPPPSAEPKQRKPKAAKEATPAPVVPTPTETVSTPMVEPVADENKALFNEVDAARNAKDRKRIKSQFGTEGEKAIFIENNINEILKEAEENGKVTKQCP